MKAWMLSLIAALFIALILAMACGDDDDDERGDMYVPPDDNDDNVYGDNNGNDDVDDDVDDDDDDADNDDDDDWSDDDISGDTWTDSSSGLTWQVDSSSNSFTWGEAITFCEDLSIDGQDDWRLPTISELRSLLRGCDTTELGGSCNVTDGCTEYDCCNDPCNGCGFWEGPASDGAYWPEGMSGWIGCYWSSSLVEDNNDRAWLVCFDFGGLGPYSCDLVGDFDDARCVRP